MFSEEEKKKIASIIEKALLKLDHPEMPKEKPKFKLHVDGMQDWSWADIEPNWFFDDGIKPIVSNLYNEEARELHKNKKSKRE